MTYISKNLTHWIGKNCINEDEKFNILCNYILKHKELLYSPCPIPFESKYGGIKSDSWSIPMVCFTDIPFSEVKIIENRYSTFGIAFKKAYMVNSCVTPVWYSLSPFVYTAYSYLYHQIKGLSSVIDGITIQAGKHKEKIFNTDEYLQQLHAFVSLCQDYKKEEFIHNEDSLIPNENMLTFFESEEAYYYEREWRSIYRNGDNLPWNSDHDGKNYFKFAQEAIDFIIVPSTYVDRLKNDISGLLSIPIKIIAFEELPTHE